MTPYHQLQTRLQTEPHTWLITGVAGFIGSNLLETLLKLNQRVVGLDNFATGHQRNLDEVQTLVTPAQWANFSFIQGDIRELADCQKACQGVDYVLHQAALGSVPRSLQDPITTNSANITGFLNMLVAARDAKVRSFTYAASSSTYGDHPGLPKVEDTIGKPLSPYAVTKLTVGRRSVALIGSNITKSCGSNTVLAGSPAAPKPNLSFYRDITLDEKWKALEGWLREIAMNIGAISEKNESEGTHALRLDLDLAGGLIIFNRDTATAFSTRLQYPEATVCCVEDKTYNKRLTTIEYKVLKPLSGNKARFNSI